MSLLGVSINRKEHALKEKVGKGLHPSDIRYSGCLSVAKMMLSSTIGGVLSGTLGISAGSIINPVIIGMGSPPLVATSTGMYMALYSTCASTVMFMSYGTLNVYFALWFSVWGSAGIMVSFSIVEALIRKY